MEKFNLRVNNAIIKIIGVFEFDNKKHELHKLLENNKSGEYLKILNYKN